MSKILLSLQVLYQATKMTLWVRASVAKPGVLSSIPRTTKGEKNSSQELCSYFLIRLHAGAYIYKTNKDISSTDLQITRDTGLVGPIKGGSEQQKEKAVGLCPCLA